MGSRLKLRRIGNDVALVRTTRTTVDNRLLRIVLGLRRILLTLYDVLDS